MNLAGKALWVSISDVAAKGLGFLATVYIARTLGPGSYGLITVALSALGYLMWIADLGLSNIGIRETAREPEQRTFRAREIFITKMGIGFAVFLLSYWVLPLLQLGGLQAEIIRWYLFSILIYSVSIEWLFNGKQEYAKLALARILQSGLYLTLIYLMVQGPDQILQIPIAYLISLGGSALLLFLLLRTISFRTLSFRSFRSVRDLILKGSYVGLGGFFAQTVNLLPPMVIAWSLSYAESGIYMAAFKVILIVMIVDKIFVTLLIPSLSRQWTMNSEAARDHILKTYRILLFSGLFCSLMLMLLADPIIKLLYTDDYQSSGLILKVLALFISFTFLNSLFSFGLISTNHEVAYLKATLKGGLAASLLIFAFSFGQSSLLVAASVVIAELMLLLFALIEFRKVIHYTYLKPFLAALPVTLILGALPIFIEMNELAYGFIATLIFVLTLWFLKIMQWDDLKWLYLRLRS
jgi:O-antigen/teichoic acid export membrane protein